MARPLGTANAAERAAQYIEHYIELAEQLNMSLVLAEFGVERDDASYSPDAGTTYRDRFFKTVFDRINTSASTGRPLVGSNFWTWGDYGRAERPDANWQNGDRASTGDPPQEAQGLNSVFSSDESTLEIQRDHAAELGTKFNRQIIQLQITN